MDVLDETLFVCKTTDPSYRQKRAILGNGYFGIDVSNNYGQGFGISEERDPFPTTYMGGVYSYALERMDPLRLDRLFRPLSMYTLIPSGEDLDDPFSVPREFSQTMNMKEAVVTTDMIWGRYATHTEIFLSRADPHLGVMKISFTPKQTMKPGDPCQFHYIVRKDPRVQYERLRFCHYENIELFETEIEEDGKKFRSKPQSCEPYQIIQACSMRIYNETGKSLDWESVWLDPEDIDLTLDGDVQYIKEITLSPGNSGKTINIELYFSIFKEADLTQLKEKTSLEKLALDSMKEALALDYMTLKDRHIQAWQKEIWARLILTPDRKTQQLIIASMYQLGCSFKAGFSNSAGPNGINGYGWEGHIFWDSDLWMNLGLILWAPELSRCITEFRLGTLNGARQHRQDYVKEYEIDGITSGAKFPWQSTTAGTEASPPGWAQQEHITCDVVYGQYLYYTATQNENYLKTVAFPIAYDACLYLGQRVRKGTDGKFHFSGVIPADEFPFPNVVDDNAFTNLYVAKCMEIVMGWAKKLSKSYPPEWEDIARNMYFTVDPTTHVIPEFTNYKGQKIKQADVNLLTFPLEWPFSEEINRANMLYYYDKLPENKIMMGSSIFSVIACELGMLNKAWEYFTDMYHHYHEKGFWIASEAPNNNCWPFLTGIAGFMANIGFGFGGIRLRADGLLVSPMLHPQMTKLVMTQISIFGTKLRYEIEAGGEIFSLTNMGDKAEFRIYMRPKRVYKIQGTTPFTLQSSGSEKFYAIKFEKQQQIRFTLVK